MDVGFWAQVVQLTRDTYLLLSTMGKDARRAYDKDEEIDHDRFYDVYMHEIHQSVADASNSYYSYFNALIDELSKPDAKDNWTSLVIQPVQDIEDSWYLKNRARERAKAWLEYLPRSSLERTYAWSAANVLYAKSSIDLTEDSLRFEADNIADSPKDTVLNTPNTAIADQIRSGVIKEPQQLIAIVEDEKKGLIARRKASERIYEKLTVKRQAATRKQRDA